MDLSDEQLMLAVATGDLAAFDTIVLRHQQALWSIAYRFLGDPAEAEDVVQEAFLRLLALAPRYRPSGGLRAYLRRVVATVCIDATRKKHPVYTDTLPDLPDSVPGPAKALRLQELQAQVRQALDALAPQQRMVLILRHYEELSYADIAAAMGTTPKAVEGLLHRARRSLRSSLAKLNRK